jgi:hypothetical protein
MTDPTLSDSIIATLVILLVVCTFFAVLGVVAHVGEWISGRRKG